MGTAAAILLYGMAAYCFSFQRPAASFPARANAAPAAVPLSRTEADREPRLDINTASMEALTALPGIGPVYAQAIVDRRAALGPFHFVEELLDVPGIGEKRLELLRPLISCEPQIP